MDEEQSIDFAKEYLENIVSFFGVNIAVNVSCDDEVIQLDVESSEENSLLIGRNAETLRSMQHILSSALHNNGAYITRVNVDIADYKKQRADKLAEKARGWMKQVIETGEDYEANINPADRRVVHHVAEEFDEITTHSEGEGRNRRLVISKV